MLAIYRLLPEATRESWKDLLSELTNGIEQLLTPAQARRKLAECRQKEGKAPGTYMLRIKQLAERAYAVNAAEGESWTQDQQNQMIITTFRKGLIPSLYAEAIRREAESMPFRELQKVIAESRRLKIIVERKQEHEAASTSKAAMKNLSTRTKRMENTRRLHLIAKTQHRSLVQGATTSTPRIHGRQLQLQHHERNFPKRLRCPNSGYKRRVPRKYRIRGARRRKRSAGGSEQRQEPIFTTSHAFKPLA